MKVKNYPDTKEAIPLVSKLKLKEGADPKLKILMNKLFCKILLVKTYSLAMEYAKEFNLTCITPDLQIVYAGAFVTKVGYYNKSQADRISAFSKVNSIQKQVEIKMQDITNYEKERI